MISERLLAQLEDPRPSSRVLFQHREIELRLELRCTGNRAPGGWGCLVPSSLKDGTNSVRVVVDEAGAAVASHDYDAFGNLLAESVPIGGGGQPWPFEHRAFGELYDRDLGMTFLRARWMDPADGRLTSRDPFEGDTDSPASLHRYMYAANSPLNMGDPSGRETVPLPSEGNGSRGVPRLRGVRTKLLNHGVSPKPGCGDVTPKKSGFEDLVDVKFNCAGNGDDNGKSTGRIHDECGNSYEIRCQWAQYLLYFYPAGRTVQLVGFCVYGCGINSWQVLKNTSDKRFLVVRHRTEDRPGVFARKEDGSLYNCDEGTPGLIDWTSRWLDTVSGASATACREGVKTDWEMTSNSACETGAYGTP